MEQRAIILDGISRGRGVLEQAVEGLSPEELLYRPGPEANPIGWLAWHVARVEDMHVADLEHREQLWIADAYHDTFGMAPDARDFGTRHTLDQVGTVRPPSSDALLEYYHAVAARTDAYIDTLTPEHLDVVLNEPQFSPLPTVGVRLNSLIHHIAHHAAQAAYVRGLLDTHNQSL